MLERYQYEIAGGLLGLILAILLLTLGFFKTILLFLMVGVGGGLGVLFKDTGILETIQAKWKK